MHKLKIEIIQEAAEQFTCDITEVKSEQWLSNNYRSLFSIHLGTKCQQEQYLCFCIGVNRNSEAQKVGTAGNFAKTCLGHPNVLLQAKYILKNGSV